MYTKISGINPCVYRESVSGMSPLKSGYEPSAALQGVEGFP